FVCAVLGTAKLVTKAPLLPAVVVPTCVASNLIVMASPPVKPVPLTVTFVEGAPDCGESVMLGLAACAAFFMVTTRPSPIARITTSESIALTNIRGDKRIVKLHFPRILDDIIFMRLYVTKGPCRPLGGVQDRASGDAIAVPALLSHPTGDGAREEI